MSRQLLVCSETLNLVQRTLPLQPLHPEWARVKVKAVSINPVDYKLVAFKLAIGAGLGCDFSGTVLEVGDKVTIVKPGDSVAGLVAGEDTTQPDVGSFTNILDVPTDALFIFENKLVSNSDDYIPAGPITSFEQAASLGVTVMTAAMAFIYNNSIPLVHNSQKGLGLVYGGGGSLGWNVALMAKWLGYRVIVIASLKHRELYSKVGITDLYDYKDPDWVNKVKSIGEIEWAYDPIGEGSSFEDVCSAVSGSLPVKINTGHPVSSEDVPANITHDAPNAFLWFNQDRMIGQWHVTIEQGFIDNRAKQFVSLNQYLSTLTSMPITVCGNGLASIPAGMESAKSASGTKYVVRL